MKDFFKNPKVKIVTATFAILFACALAFTSVFAFFKYEEADEATVTTMNTDIILNQVGVTDNSISYTISPTKENTDYVYVRATIFPIIEIQDSVGSSTYNAYAGIPTSNIKYTVTGDNWNYYDGYYYYQYQIDSGTNSVRTTTDKLEITGIELTTKSYDDTSNEWFELPTKVDGKSIRVRFYVSAEAVQAKNNAYQLSWDLTESQFKSSVGIKDLNTIYDKSDGIKTNLNVKEDKDNINKDLND